MENNLKAVNSTSSFDKDHSFLFGNEFEPDIADAQSEIDSSDSINSMAETSEQNIEQPDDSTIRRSIGDHIFRAEGDVESVLDSDYEDNNPFKGSCHQYANGIHNSIKINQDARLSHSSDVTSNINRNTPEKSFRQLKSTNNTVKLPNSISFIKIPTISENDVELLGSSAGPMTINEDSDNSVSDEIVNKYSYIRDRDLLIKIVYAGRYQFSDGKTAIGYTIVYKGKRVIRRYTDFVKLRQTLKKLLPTILIPPIPDRHSLMSYIFQPFHFSLNYSRNNGGKRLIDDSNETLLRRARLFEKFLNICISKTKIKNCSTFLKFIDSEFPNWEKVMSQPPVTILPATNLLVPPLDPIKPSPLHLLLPVPKQLPLIDEADENMILWLKNYNKNYITPSLRVFDNLKSHIDNSIDYIAELGGLYNVASIETQIFTIQQHFTEEEFDSQDHSINTSFGSFIDRRYSVDSKSYHVDDLSRILEKVGQIYDSNYVSTKILANDLAISFKEPLEMLAKFNDEALSLIDFKLKKTEQNNIIVQNFKKLQDRYDFLEGLNKINVSHIESSIREEEEEAADENAREFDTALSDEHASNEGDISVDSIIAENSKNDYIESILLKNKANSKAIQSAIAQYSIQKRESAYKTIMKDLPKKNIEVKKENHIVKSPTISREKINLEMSELKKKLNNIKILNDLSDKDISEIEGDLASELDFSRQLYSKVWSSDIIAQIKASVLAWSNENLSHWQTLLEEYESDDVI